MTAYDTDYGVWLSEQINHLKTHEWEHLDVDNLIAELDGLSRFYKRELDSYLIVLLSQLLKWHFLPQMRSGRLRGWTSHSRRQIYRLFKDQPSLKPYTAEILVAAYADASELAAIQIEIPVSILPSECPYTIEQILDTNFFPGPPMAEDDDQEQEES